MNVYQGITRTGDWIVHCDRLDDFFAEFIQYRKWKSKTNNFNKNTFPFKEWKKSDKNHPYNPEKDYYWAIFYLDLNFDDAFRKTKKTIVYWERPLGWETSFDYSTCWDLGINVSKAFKIKKDAPLESSEWKQWNQQREKIEKVLKDIWTTGKIKDTYGLDLNWPSSKQTETKKNPAPKPKNKNQTSSPNKNTSINEQSNPENNKIYWIIGSLVLVSLIGVVFWFVFRKKSSKFQKK